MPGELGGGKERDSFSHLVVPQHDITSVDLPSFRAWVVAGNHQVRFSATVAASCVLALALDDCLVDADDGRACRHRSKDTKHHFLVWLLSSELLGRCMCSPAMITSYRKAHFDKSRVRSRDRRMFMHT